MIAASRWQSSLLPDQIQLPWTIETGSRLRTPSAPVCCCSRLLDSRWSSNNAEGPQGPQSTPVHTCDKTSKWNKWNSNTRTFQEQIKETCHTYDKTIKINKTKEIIQKKNTKYEFVIGANYIKISHNNLRQFYFKYITDNNYLKFNINYSITVILILITLCKFNV